MATAPLIEGGQEVRDISAIKQDLVSKRIHYNSPL